MSNDEAVAAADYSMRNWLGAEPGRIKIGSDAHKRLFCRMLLDTHNPYKPAVLDVAASSSPRRCSASLRLADLGYRGADPRGAPSIRVEDLSPKPCAIHCCAKH